MTGSQGVQVDVALDLQMLDAVGVIQDLLGELDAHLGQVVKTLAGVEEVAHHEQVLVAALEHRDGLRLEVADG